MPSPSSSTSDTVVVPSHRSQTSVYRNGPRTPRSKFSVPGSECRGGSAGASPSQNGKLPLVRDSHLAPSARANPFAGNNGGNPTPGTRRPAPISPPSLDFYVLAFLCFFVSAREPITRHVMEVLSADADSAPVEVFDIRIRSRQAAHAASAPPVTHPSVAPTYDGLPSRLRSSHLRASVPPCLSAWPFQPHCTKTARRHHVTPCRISMKCKITKRTQIENFQAALHQKASPSAPSLHRNARAKSNVDTQLHTPDEFAARYNGQPRCDWLWRPHHGLGGGCS